MNTDQLAWLGSAGAFALSMCATPGPNNAMATASGGSFGFMRTVPHILGVAAGFPVMLIAMTLGAGEAFGAIPGLQPALRWVGIAYLLWLAFRIATAPTSGGAVRAASRPLTILQAALFQWVNPKAWVIALGTIAAFAPGSTWPRVAALCIIFFAATLLSMSFWTAVGLGAVLLLRTDAQRRAFNVAMAGLLVASVAPLVQGE